jgi:type II secretory pathway pseudopilin PulG
MHARPSLRRSRSRRGRAYTVVEVLLSLTVLAIGASAVMSMQKAALQANLDARKTDMANAIARMWLERVRRDAMLWTLPSPANTTGNNFSSAKLLQYVGSGWVLPIAYAGQTPPVSPGFDGLGRDIANVTTTSTPAPVYCVNIQETYMATDATNVANNLIRVDLRVLWVRGINAGASNPCALATTALPDPGLYQSLYMTTVVRANSLP